jgi:predicted dehydrogenase
MIRDGRVGQVQEISSCFGFNIAPGEWRLSKKLAGGGPLYDVGIYSLNATRYLTGEEPAKITAVASTIDHDGRFNEVEENVSWTTLFPSGIVASCSTSYGANTSGYFKVYGSKGWLALDPGFNYDGVHMHGFIEGKEIDELNPARDPYQFTAQADHFSNCVQNNLEPKTPGEEGLKDMRLIAEIYRSAGVGA